MAKLALERRVVISIQQPPKANTREIVGLAKQCPGASVKVVRWVRALGVPKDGAAACRWTGRAFPVRSGDEAAPGTTKNRFFLQRVTMVVVDLCGAQMGGKHCCRGSRRVVHAAETSMLPPASDQWLLVGKWE